MTPARKKALQWFYDRGEVDCDVFNGMGGPSPRMLIKMIDCGQLSLRPSEDWRVDVYTLTDKGRQALHGDDV